MGSEQAGDYSSSLRNNAFSTIEGEGDTMTTAASGLDDLEHRDREIAANRSAVSSTGWVVDTVNSVFAIYQIMLSWKTYSFYYETDELPNPRPAQPKKN